MVDGPLPIPFLVHLDRMIIRECKTDLFVYDNILSYSGYSYRIGAVTELVRRGCPPEMLHGMGRWLRASWEDYVALNPEERAHWTAVLYR